MHVVRTPPFLAATVVILWAAACGGGGGGGGDAKPAPPPPGVELSITRVEPPQGSREDKIKLTGPGLGQVTSVRFGVWYADFRVLDATSLEAKVPDFATTGKLIVRCADLREAVSAEDFRVVPPRAEAPVLDSVAPLKGAPGLQVTLTGRGLGEPRKVTFGGVEAGPPVVVTPTLLMVKVPPHAHSGAVTVTTDAGTAHSRERFQVLAEGVEVPVIHSVFPLRGAVGERVTIHGEGLQHHARIAFAGTPAAALQVAATFLETQVPAWAVTGPLTLANAAGDVIQAGTFTVIAVAVPVAITSFEPETGPPDTRVFIKGPGVGKAVEARLGTQKCFHYPWSEDQLAVYLPSAHHRPATGPLKLLFPDGSSVETPRPFRITVQAPEVESFSPSGGPPGLAVTVRGRHLGDLRGVWFGDVEADAIADATDSAFVVAVPAGAATGALKVTTPGGTALSRTDFTVTAEGAAGELSLPKAYITQGSQDLEGSMPLVEGRPGVFRAFVQASARGVAAPSVRVILRDARGTEVLNHVIPPSRSQAPTSIREGSLAESWNLPIPGDALTPGSTLLAEVVADGARATFPEDGRPLALDVRAVPPLEVTLVPIRSGERVGRVTGGGRTLEDWSKALKAMYPLAQVVVREGPAFTAAKRLGDSLVAYVEVMEELEVARLMDPGDTWRYRVGVYQRPPGGTLNGMAMSIDNRKGSSRERSAVVYDGDSRSMGGSYFAETMVHELGHLMGRSHSPCGVFGGSDPDYPHPKAGLGAHGFDVAGHETIDAGAYKDIMSYCYPRWPSDYTYRAILAFRSGDPLPAAEATLRMEAQREDCLLVWGRIVDGHLTLEPTFQCRREPELPKPGDYRLVLRDARGEVLREIPFEATPAADVPPSHDYRNFAFVIPRPRGLATLEVVHDGLVLGAIHAHHAALRAEHRAPVARPWGPGKVHVSWDYGAHPRVVVKDPAGQILAVASGGAVEVATTATELELAMSDGIHTEVVKVPVGE